MKVKIEKSKLKGDFFAPPSKSYAHRALISAGFSDGKSVIRNIEYSNDIKATISCLKSLGVDIKEYNNYCEIEGLRKVNINPILDCNECGTTYRLFIPLVLALDIDAKLIGSKKLLSRPINVYEEIFKDKDIVLQNTGDELLVKGHIKDNNFTLRGDVSSQFVTGLMYACAVMKKDSIVEVLKPVESRPYIDMTRDVFKCFSVNVTIESENDKSIKYNINSKNGFKGTEYIIEGDYSNAAFFEAMNDYSDINIKGLNKDSVQGDKAYIEFFKKIRNGFTTINIGDTPDLAPVLLSYSCMHEGVKLTNTRRLKIKESDRGLAMKEELYKFGINVDVKENDITISEPHLKPPPDVIYSHNDHRIVMALTVLGLNVGDTIIDGAESVNKSFGNFFNKVKELGGNISEVDS